jgi:rod shape determining protein RodA
VRTDAQNVIKSFNTGLVVSTLTIFLMGLITLYSATKGEGSFFEDHYKKQLLFFVVGSLFGLIIIFVDSGVFEKVSYLTYVICLGLLILVMLIGHTGKGSERWINLGFFHLQPSEFAKIGIVFTLAKYFSDEKRGGPYSLRRLFVPGLLIFPYFIIILKQPDMGTAGILFLTAASIILFVRVELKSLIVVGLIAVITVPVAYKYFLKDYQRHRVQTFLDPNSDPTGKGYNALQCRIAVGSGQITGKGYLKGTQAQLNFIPEQHTDFIFSVFAEEWGFLGGLVLLAMYFSYIAFASRAIQRGRNKFETLLGMGLCSLMFWHVFINIGMVSGILPIVGVTLPFFSYGGSSLLTFVVATSLLLNLSRKKYIF